MDKRRVIGIAGLLLLIVLIFSLNSLKISGFVSADWGSTTTIGHSSPPESFADKVIWQLPELSEYTYGGSFTHASDSTCLDFRYYPPQGGNQHSEFNLCAYNTSEEANAVLRDDANGVRSYYNDVSIVEVNGNKIFNLTHIPAEAEAVIWVSGNNVLQGWGGSDDGTTIDTALFNVLLNAYLVKYPSTYGCEGANCNPSFNNPPKAQESESNSSSITTSNQAIPNPTEQNTNIVKIEPNATTGPIEMPKQTASNEETSSNAATPSKESSVVCNGCELDKKCYPFGYRVNGDYCLDDKNFVKQKAADSSCENNFECTSNLCVSGSCVSEGLWQKILNWFKSLFG